MTSRKRPPTGPEMEQAELADLAVQVGAEWVGPQPRPHIVAHLDTKTGTVTFVWRGLPEQLAHIRAALAEYAAATSESASSEVRNP